MQILIICQRIIIDHVYSYYFFKILFYNSNNNRVLKLFYSNQKTKKQWNWNKDAGWSKRKAWR